MLYRRCQHLQTLQVKEMADVRLTYHIHIHIGLHIRDGPIIPTVNLMTLTTRRTRLWLIVTAESSQGDHSLPASQDNTREVGLSLNGACSLAGRRVIHLLHSHP